MFCLSKPVALQQVLIQCYLILVSHKKEIIIKLALVGDVYCIFVTFPCGILGQVWYLIVSFPDLYHLSYF